MYLPKWLAALIVLTLLLNEIPSAMAGFIFAKNSNVSIVMRAVSGGDANGTLRDNTAIGTTNLPDGFTISKLDFTFTPRGNPGDRTITYGFDRTFTFTTAEKDKTFSLLKGLAVIDAPSGKNPTLDPALYETQVLINMNAQANSKSSAKSKAGGAGSGIFVLDSGAFSPSNDFDGPASMVADLMGLLTIKVKFDDPAETFRFSFGGAGQQGMGLLDSRIEGTPEPSTLLLIGPGCLLLAYWWWRGRGTRLDIITFAFRRARAAWIRQSPVAGGRDEWAVVAPAYEPVTPVRETVGVAGAPQAGCPLG